MIAVLSPTWILKAQDYHNRLHNTLIFCRSDCGMFEIAIAVPDGSFL